MRWITHLGGAWATGKQLERYGRDKLRAAGVSDLKTQSVNLNPRFVENGGVQGFSASNGVRLRAP